MEQNIIILSCIYLLGIGFLLIINEICYRKMDIKTEISRKFAHFLSVLATVPFPYIFSSHWYVLALAIVFFIVLFATQKGTLLGSIHDVKRKTMGSYLIPTSCYIIFLISDLTDSKLLYILPMLILAISDPIAAIVGIGLEKYNHRIVVMGYDTHKSLFGCTAFFTSSLLICLLAMYFNLGVFDVHSLVMAVTIALITTIAELFCQKGIDNLVIPLSAIGAILLF